MMDPDSSARGSESEGEGESEMSEGGSEGEGEGSTVGHEDELPAAAAVEEVSVADVATSSSG